MCSLPVSLHSALWVHRWGEDLIPHIARAAELGYDGVEVSLLGLADSGGSELRQVAQDLGIALKCTTGLAVHQDITSTDASVRRRGRDSLLRAADLVATIGSDLLTGVIYAPWGAMGSPQTRPDRQQRSADMLAQVAPHFFDRGITLGVEAVNRFETDLVNTSEEALAFVELVGAPNIGVHLDTFHMNIEETDIVSAVRHASRRLTHVHVCGPNRGIPTPGRFPYPELFSELAQVGYMGWIGLEMFVQSGTSVSPDLRIWRQIETSPTEAAKQAKELVRSWMQQANETKPND